MCHAQDQSRVRQGHGWQPPAPGSIAPKPQETNLHGTQEFQLPTSLRSLSKEPGPTGVFAVLIQVGYSQGEGLGTLRNSKGSEGGINQ